MASKMTHTVRAELANAVRRRYRAATGKQKRRILDEFIATTGYHEKSAIRVLNAAPPITTRQTRNRPSFALRALDVDNGTEFVNETLIQYCLSRGIELTRSRPYWKNDQAWIEQENGAVVRKLLGYRRFAGIAAARAITRPYAASRLFVNFFQPSFELAAKHREGARVSKRYYPPQTGCQDPSAQRRHRA